MFRKKEGEGKREGRKKRRSDKAVFLGEKMKNHKRGRRGLHSLKKKRKGEEGALLNTRVRRKMEPERRRGRKKGNRT